MGVVRKLYRLADRTAVLAVGVVAGIGIGLSFNAAGRQQVAGWFQPQAIPTPHPAATPSPRPAGPAPVAKVDPRVASRVAADGRLRIGVFGDSFGNGVWDALYRQLPAAERYDVLRFSKEATGFTRYHSLDLEQRAREQIGQQPIDVAVICFGANDLQPIYEERRIQPLLGDDWKRIIGARIDRFVAAVRSTGASVFWLGLPVMRDPDTDDQIQQMDAFYAERMRALNVPFIDTRPASLDADGHYNAHLVDAATGRTDLVRTPDGMHMTGMGYQRITAGVVQQVRTIAALARRRAGLPAQAVKTDQPAGDAPTLHRERPVAKPVPEADTPDRDARQTARANRHEQEQVRHLENGTGDPPPPGNSGGER